LRKTGYKKNIIKKTPIYTVLLLLFLNLSFYVASSQEKSEYIDITPREIWNSGLPHIENYTSGDYKSSPQNWAFTERNDGFLYIGNTEGIIQYDGNSWNTIELKNKSIVRSLAATDKGEIFVGGVDELGYLAPDKVGQMNFYSLKSFLNLDNQDFGDIWTTVTSGELTFFSCSKYLFRWNGKKFDVWKPKENFGNIFKVNSTLYIESKGVGLHKMEEDSLYLVPGGEFLKDTKGKIDVMLPYQNDKILIAHSYLGLLLYDGEHITSISHRNNNLFQKNRIYKGVTLSNGDYAMATLTSGVYVIDGKTGKVKKRFGKKHGLISDVLYSVYEDRGGNIWVGSDNGISKIDWTSPFRVFNELGGLKERIRSLKYHNNRFLVGSKGMYQLVKSDSYIESNELTFRKIEGIETNIRYIIPVNNDILALDSEYIYKIGSSNKAKLIRKQDWTLTSVVKSTIDSTKIYVGTIDGKLLECRLSENQWHVNPLLQIDAGIHGIVEEPKGNLWLETYYKGMYYAQKQSGKQDKHIRFELKKYDTLLGLPSMTYNFPYQFVDKVYVTTQDGMYCFNQTDQNFVKDTVLMKQYDKTVDAFGFMGLDKDGNIWQTVKSGFENKIYKLSENKLSELQEYNVFNDFETYSIEFMDDIILFIGPKGILGYNKNSTRIPNKNLTTKLRKVWVNNDSLVYAGVNALKNKNESFEIPFVNNTLKFEYTLPFFSKPKNNVYQYLLEGFDNDWSTWSAETKKDYTNLPAGDYNFKVRSKNVFNQIAEEDSFAFVIIPPWYQSWAAYLFYGIGAIAVLILFSKWRSRELKKKNIALEEVIKERTLEISYKNELLGQQTEKLIEMGNAKTKLYSNITHEFRTPLTVILGMADSLRLSVENESFDGAEKSLEMIHRNGESLLHLVNEMLDLAKSESGNMELKLIQTDVVPLVKYLSESFHSLAEENQIKLAVYSEIDKLVMDLDLTKLTSILSNILSNAIKFTAPLGKIIVHINTVVQEKEECLLIKVKDDGKGIAEEELPNVFNRFYQTEESSSIQNGGTGIGLALTKELVELMNGTISVKSKLETGSEFSIMIPVTRKAPIKKDISTPIKSHISDADSIPKKVDQVQINDPELPLVLIIEDNLDVAHYLKICLKETYTTIHAVNGIQGIEFALERVPDIIICDVMMPGKNGYEVCATLKSDERTDHIPIIMLTAKVTQEDRIRGLSHGADAYLPKPFNKKELFIRLNQLVLVRKKLIEKIQNNGFYQFLNKSSEKPEAKFLQKIIKIIHEEMDNSNFGPSELAKNVHLSESQVYRKLKAITDKSTAVFIRSIRLQKAKELIITTDKTISEIAYDVGFNDPSWFSRAFKEEFGTSPSDIDK
ncbi:hybrid sensor histidine kinase/response regulator transcription factor, partial [Aquimarina spinulae]|uniref:hybrid sensor histidine kinase/response regulator transcription factor n=1 Tax=Aquimarina spinulae TaxID=1192023 RepID=UPI0010430AF3